MSEHRPSEHHPSEHRPPDYRPPDHAIAAGASGVAIEGLSKTYGPAGEVRALDDISLDIPAGRCTVLLGPSGCGKTTVLRSIAGLATPTTGRIRIGSDIVCDTATGLVQPPERRRLGMVFQSYALWPHLTVLDNIGYPLVGRMRRDEVRTRADAMLDWIGLPGMGGRFIHELSGGQQQRVSLARAMIGNPRAVLFDEPLSNLDARLRERMRLEILALRQRAPFTSIYVTHDQLEAMTLGDQVVIMRAGRIEQVGTPEQVFRMPRTRFAADFMGIPNLIDGIAGDLHGDRMDVQTAIGPLPCRVWRTDRPRGAPCTVAVRPTLIAITPAANGPAQVLRSVFQGNSTLHVVAVGDTCFTVESTADDRLADGARVEIRPTPGAIFAVLDD